MKTRLRVAGAAAVLGCVLAGLMVSVALDHNPQGEFIDSLSGDVQWPAVLSLFALWFIVGSFASSLVILAGKSVVGGFFSWLARSNSDT